MSAARAIRVVPLLVAIVACSAPSGSPVDPRRSAWVAAGEAIFNDESLGVDGAIGCASCHKPALAFTDARPRSIGVSEREGTRNAPSLLDIAAFDAFFWDGRQSDLSEAVLEPFTNPREMGHRDLQAALAVVLRDHRHLGNLRRAMGGRQAMPGHRELARALVTYLRSLDHGTSRYEAALRGEGRPLSDKEQAGLALFRGKADCSACHALEARGSGLTDNRFHHAGVGFAQVAGRITPLRSRLAEAKSRSDPLGELVLSDPEIAELGRFAVTGKARDLGAFRTPTLRNVGNTAPYMHDGSIATLQAAIDHEIYYRGISRGRPISLTVEERDQLESFLRTLDVPAPVPTTP